MIQLSVVDKYRLRKFGNLAFALIVAIALTLTMGTFPASAAVIQDQSNTGTAIGSVFVNSDRDRAQSFIAAVSGRLVSIRLNGCDYNDDTSSLTVALYPASGTAPNSTPDVSASPLAQQILTGTSLSILPSSTACAGNEGAEFTITFDSPAAITAGSAYAFTLDATQSSVASPQGVMLASTAQGDYPEGNRSTFATGPSWIADTTRNLVFATFVDDGRLAADSSEAREPLILSLSSTCTGGNPTGITGTWITLPTASDCAPPLENPDAELLGWSTEADFPIDIARRQVDNGWGAYETFDTDGRLTGVFIPTGGSTLVTAAGTLYAIWSD